MDCSIKRLYMGNERNSGGISPENLDEVFKEKGLDPAPLSQGGKPSGKTRSVSSAVSSLKDTRKKVSGRNGSGTSIPETRIVLSGDNYWDFMELRLKACKVGRFDHIPGGVEFFRSLLEFARENGYFDKER